MKPEKEGLDDSIKSSRKKKKSKFNATASARKLNEWLRGDANVDPATTYNSRKNPGRVAASHVSKGNPKSWYLKYVDITPAKNINRPMEPIFNTGFSKNGTNGVPKFVELDVEWTGYAETFMMDQVAYQAIQQIRKALKSNLFYSDREVKECLVNAIALTVYGKQIERDVHWNLFSGSNDFNFGAMYRMRNQVIGTYGIIPLYPIAYLLDENLPYTSVIYDKIVSSFNQVINLPSRISEFLSHYFGSLFTLDKDGFNDQYLQINMHGIDWYDDDHNLVTLDLAEVTLDEYMSLLNAYSKRFAVIITDLQKCLGVTNLKLCRYEEYNYAFVFDKTLLQALINGYTSNVTVENGYVRLDQMPGVDDDLTQYLFLGGIQPDDNSLAQVHAIRILDMVLKCNSDDQIQWAKTLDQLPVQELSSASKIQQDDPFGFALTTDFIVDNTTIVDAFVSGETGLIAIPNFPNTLPTQTARTELRFVLGASGNSRFPSSLYRLDYDRNADPTSIAAAALVYQCCLVNYISPGIYDGTFVYAASVAQISSIPVNQSRFPFSGEFVFTVRTTLENLRIIARNIQSKGASAVYFCNILISDTAGSIMNHLNHKYDTLALGTITGYAFNPWTTYPTDDRICCLMTRYSSWVNMQIVTFIGSSVGSTLTWVINDTSTAQISIMPESAPAPAGLTAFRSAWVNATTQNATMTASCVDGGEATLMYVTQVVDYHIPVAYRHRYHITASFPDAGVSAELKDTSLPVLVKEDYIPYFYNVLDLIPVLYEMFVSLFSIDAIKKEKFR